MLGNDGYAIAREILTSDTYVNQGVFLARDAAKMAKRATGDGSTTAIVLADAMVQNGLRMVGAGFEPNAVARGIERAARLVCERLQESAISVTTQRELDVVARQAAGGDTEVGSAMAEAMHRVGGENVLLEEGGYGPQIEVNVDESFSMAGGFIDPNLIPNRGATEATLENAMVFVSTEEVKDMHAFARVLQQSATAGCPLLAVAPDFDSDVLALIMVNSLNRRATCVPVVAPGHGVTRQDVLEDMAVFTGATLVDAAGLAGFARRGGGLGSAEAVVVGRRPRFGEAAPIPRRCDSASQRSPPERRMLKHFTTGITSMAVAPSWPDAAMPCFASAHPPTSNGGNGSEGRPTPSRRLGELFGRGSFPAEVPLFCGLATRSR